MQKHQPPKRTTKRQIVALTTAVILSIGVSRAQPAPSTNASPAATPEQEEEIIILTPFEVSAEAESGYTAASTLAGNRLNTEIRDLGNAVSVITGQFLKDIGATDNRSLLQYTTNTEVGSIYGNFAGVGDGATLTENAKFTNPNTNTRVRGLTAADNTRDYFLTDIPWDGYNIDRVDLQRGPNSILFGQGSPAGIINSGTKQASFRNSNEVVARYGSYGSWRASVDINRVILKDELAIRLNGVYDDEKFKQDPAYELNKRIYGAIRYEPKFLKKADARTVLKANFEAGDISSNMPRSIPPIDRISPWFGIDPLYPELGAQPGYLGQYTYDRSTSKWTATRSYASVNKSTYTPFQMVDNNTGRAGNGVTVANQAWDNGSANPVFQPWLQQTYGNLFGGPLGMFNADGSDASAIPGSLVNFEPYETRLHKGGLSSTGAVDGTIGGLAWTRPGSIGNYSNYARRAGLPFSGFGVYKDISITDPSIFDFYNNLIDGNNKREWQKFTAYNISLAQTFFSDQVGFEAVYDRQTYRNGQVALLSGERVALNIDVNSIYSDGSLNGTGVYPNNVPFADGTPNTNVGRAYISDSAKYGNNSYNSRRESKRLTGFVSHDFTHDWSGNWAMRFLGKHTVTGLYSTDRLNRDNRAWVRYSADDTYYNWFRRPNENLKFNDDLLTPNTLIYLGDTLKGASSPANARIPAAAAESVINSSNNVYIYDGSSWNKPTNPTAAGYVNPGAQWIWPLYAPTFSNGVAVPDATRIRTQSENPDNYVGWRKVNIGIIDSEAAAGNRDLNAYQGLLQKSTLSSKAAVWQGHFWDNAIVGTWGVRKDTAKSYEYSVNVNSAAPAAANNGRINFSRDQYKLSDTPSNRLDVTSHSWMVVAHLNQLPGIAKFAEKLPVAVSLFYNKSTDFQPAAARVDLYGDPLAAPSGKTTDKGILIETPDGRYSLKIGWYETISSNASSSALSNATAIGDLQARGANWSNRFEFNWTSNDQSGAVAVNDPTNSMYNYGQAAGESIEQAQAREAAAIAAWRTWQQSVDPRFYTAWKINLNDRSRGVTSSAPNGFAVTEDSKSEGFEVEFNAMPVKNWRIAVNASKTEAIRYNIGGTALLDFVSAYENAIRNTAAGDLRIWWGTPANDTTLFQWNSGPGSEIKQRTLQNGTAVPELRKWRYNVITNYDFDQAWLKGINVGAGVRYESGNVIGYMPTVIAGDIGDPVDMTWDLTKSFKADSLTNFDLWVGYTRKIWHDIDWNLQLNVRNVGVGNELIPITVNPKVLADGTMGYGPGTYRIRPPMTWELTSTFRF